MGRIRIPPLPQYMVLIDRDDDTRWMLTHTLTPATSDGFGYFSITTPVPRNVYDYMTFGKYDGPILSTQPTVKLLVRGGYLGYEQETLPISITDRDNPRILSRRGVARESREIYIPNSWVHTPDRLAWTPISISTGAPI